MALRKITVTSKAAQTSASNSLNVRPTTGSSPNANIKKKSITEMYAKTTSLPQQVIVALPILESAEKSASQKRSTASTTNSSDVMPVMMIGTTSAKKLDALKLQLEAPNHAL
ncbi:hypothetical protein JCGZ_07887 [Jatropha curcas]|uniref:Uncharacterized protein n=1 Tax=Jatropha curcas TaxID=180498 RepID=A0A067KXV7_JATCU|nr:hypothetical protein JCGZ_07887 [Jatropha curcas]